MSFMSVMIFNIKYLRFPAVNKMSDGRHNDGNMFTPCSSKHTVPV